MTFETEFWLAPLFGALLSYREGGESFARLMESAITAGAASKRGVDWIGVGQMMRDELGWDDHPALPSQILN